MAKRLRDYIEYISKIDSEKLSEQERKDLVTDMLVNIQFFQHERLIHLIVTALFAIMAMFGLWGALNSTTNSDGFFAFFALVMVLLVPYIRHYYILENGVQKLYSLYNKILKA